MNNAKTQRMKENKRKEETGRLIAFHLSADDFDRKEKMNCNKDSHFLYLKARNIKE